MLRRGAALRVTAALALPLVAAGCTRGSAPVVAASPTVMGAEVGRATAAPSGPVTATLDDGAGVEVVAGAGSVWVAGTEQILRVDAATNRIVARIDAGGFPTALAMAGGALWATTFR
ncbi:MAG: hypothetical protein ACRDKW_17515, partial [Actinomycetota bacterium]